MVLHVFREHQLYAKLNKCIFYQKRIHYFSHIISVERITIDFDKIEALRGWPVLRNVTKFISFMGIVGYYLRFIKCFSNIASPITSL